MAHTNQTTNYQLGQFVGSDKPSWLTDYNGDMLAIDTQMKANADAAAAASSAASVADGKAEAAGDDAADALADAAAAQQTASAAAGTANQAAADIAKFNLGQASELTVTTNLGGMEPERSKLYCSKDSSGSVFKLYGALYCRYLDGITGLVNLTIPDTGLRPSQEYTVKSSVIVVYEKSNGGVSVGLRDFTVKTDGTITVGAAAVDGSIKAIQYNFLPYLLFNKSLGQ